MSDPYLMVRSGHPDFLDLPWESPINSWPPDVVVDLPAGVHRHPVVFVPYRSDIYAVKELTVALARHEFDVLRTLENVGARSAMPVGWVERPWLSPRDEGAGVIITRYVEFAFSYRELISSGGFGDRRTQMLDAFAVLLVELHVFGCFWGDCSLSNVLYRYDAGAIEAVMIDAETVELHDELTVGQRRHDLEIMIMNVAGGMADIAAEAGLDLDDADLSLGEDIAERYEQLWHELTHDEVIPSDERYRINERMSRLNSLGFDVEDYRLVPVPEGNRLRMKVTIGGRSYHSNKLRELTRIQASENQARQILSDLQYYEAHNAADRPSLKAIAAIQWRVGVFEPLLERIREASPSSDPIQGYCDFLHHRYLMSSEAGHDIGTDKAFAHWIAENRPGYEVTQPSPGAEEA